MTVEVELYRRDLALVRTPVHWLARLFRRREVVERFAARRDGGWWYERPTRRVEERVRLAIELALLEADRAQIERELEARRRATSPPG